MRANIALLVLMIAGVSFLFINPSYKKAILARYELSKNLYQNAENLATESLALDPYNRLAMHTLSHAKASLAWEKILNEADERKHEIEASLGKSVKIGQIKRISWLVKITLGQFEALDSQLISGELLEKRQKLLAWYRQLERELGAF